MITYDERRGAALILGHRIALTPTEFRLLRELVDREGYATREELVTAGLGVGVVEMARDSTPLRAHVSNLRHKLPEGCDIVSYPSRGYALDVPGMVAMVPGRPKPCRACGTTEARKHCALHRKVLFLCGHPREGNSVMHTANGRRYPRCRTCRTEISRKWRQR